MEVEFAALSSGAGKALQVFGTVGLRNNASTVFDVNGPDGLGSVQVDLANLQPPDRFARVQELLSQAYTEYGLAVQDSTVALSYGEPSFLASRDQHMQASVDLSNQAADELQRALNGG